MQGLGNDYIYVNCFEENVPDPVKTAKYVSDRHFGIGSDGLILICPSEKCDVRMRMFNADGSEGSMCGNGARCVAKYVYDHALCRKEKITLETKGGIKVLQIHDRNGLCDRVTVDMGIPFSAENMPEEIEINGEKKEFTGVDVGNPHAVYYVRSAGELKELDLERTGPFYEHHSRFPEGVNSEFVFVNNRKELTMRVWERGSGETLACGTGACASVFASVRSGKCENEVTVHLTGGDLSIRYDTAGGHIFMTGPAAEVFHGEIYIAE